MDKVEALARAMDAVDEYRYDDMAEVRKMARRRTAQQILSNLPDGYELVGPGEESARHQEFEALRAIAQAAAEAHRRWSTWRGSEASAMADLGDALAAWERLRNHASKEMGTVGGDWGS